MDHKIKSQIVYVDTSILLRIILGQKNAFTQIFDSKKIYSSELTKVEGLRNIDRSRIINKWNEKQVSEKIATYMNVMEYVSLVPMHDSILRRVVQSFIEPVKTLDAIHLATAMMVRDHLEPEILFVTHDIKQGASAKNLGFLTMGMDDN